MMQVSENELKSAYVLLKCSKKKHNDCRKTRDALLNKYPNVRRAQTTDVKINGEQWCVAATALVNSKDAKQFENELWNLFTSGKNPVGVVNVHFIIDHQ